MNAKDLEEKYGKETIIEFGDIFGPIQEIGRLDDDMTYIVWNGKWTYDCEFTYAGKPLEIGNMYRYVEKAGKIYGKKVVTTVIQHVKSYIGVEDGCS